MIFDVLSANGTDITAVPYVQRREWLEALALRLSGEDRWMVPPHFSEGGRHWMPRRTSRSRAWWQSGFRPAIGKVSAHPTG